MPIQFRHSFFALFAGVFLAGCNGFAPKPVALFDLGLVEASPPTAHPAPKVVQLQSPSWLDSGAMQYRLEWDQPLRRRAFAESRWAAQPPEMLARTLDRSIRSKGTSTSDCRLRVELDEFIQVFQSPELSHIEIVARVSWLPARSETALARKEFSLTQPARPATAEGGVAAYRDAVARLSVELGVWLEELDAQGADAASCRA